MSTEELVREKTADTGTVVVTELACTVCGHRWIPRTPNPKTCPRCKHFDWREKDWEVRPRGRKRKATGGVKNVRKKQPSAIDLFKKSR